ncbi:MAG: CsbD family protein [Devosia sp.]|nr:CsbD family protein [Devosia sp.]
MDKNRIEGAGKQVKGAMKDAAGKLSGDVKLETQGKVEKAVGQAQSAFGKAKDDIRDAHKH